MNLTDKLVRKYKFLNEVITGLKYVLRFLAILLVILMAGNAPDIYKANVSGLILVFAIMRLVLILRFKWVLSALVVDLVEKEQLLIEHVKVRDYNEMALKDLARKYKYYSFEKNKPISFLASLFTGVDLHTLLVENKVKYVKVMLTNCVVGDDVKIDCEVLEDLLPRVRTVEVITSTERIN
jgi:hypothetical protein